MNYVDKETQEWNADLIETKKLEIYRLHSAQRREHKTNLEKERNTADLYNEYRLEGLTTQSLARTREPRILGMVRTVTTESL